MADGANAIVARRSRIFVEEQDIREDMNKSPAGLEPQQSLTHELEKKKGGPEDGKRSSAVVVGEVINATRSTTLSTTMDSMEVQGTCPIIASAIKDFVS